MKGGEADRFAGYKGRRALIFAQRKRENGKWENGGLKGEELDPKEEGRQFSPQRKRENGKWENGGF